MLLQCRDHFGGGLVAIVGILGQQLVDHALEARVLGWQRRHRFVDVGIAHGKGVTALEDLVAGQHLEKHHAHGVEIGAGIGGLAHAALGTHVVRRADHGAHLGEARFGVTLLGDTEIHQHGLAAFVEHHVLRFDVAMQHVALVGMLQRAANLDHHLDRVFGAQTFLDLVGQVAARQDLHRQVVVLVDHAAGEYGDDVVVVEAGDGVAFDLQRGQKGLVGCRARRDDLDGHLALGLQLVRQVDARHAAATDLLEELKIRDFDRCIHQVGGRSVRTMADHNRANRSRSTAD